MKRRWRREITENPKVLPWSSAGEAAILTRRPTVKESWLTVHRGGGKETRSGRAEFQERGEDIHTEVQKKLSHTTNLKQVPNTALMSVTSYNTTLILFQLNNGLNVCFVLTQAVMTLKSTSSH